MKKVIFSLAAVVAFSISGLLAQTQSAITVVNATGEDITDLLGQNLIALVIDNDENCNSSTVSEPELDVYLNFSSSDAFSTLSSTGNYYIGFKIEGLDDEHFVGWSGTTCGDFDDVEIVQIKESPDVFVEFSFDGDHTVRFDAIEE